jgi:hypothetical protein
MTITQIGAQLASVAVRTPEPVPATPQERPPVEEDALAALAAQYSVELQPVTHAVIWQAMQQTTDPIRVASNGIFLSKLGLPVHAASLQVLESVQRWEPASPPAPAAIEVLATVSDVVTGLAEHMQYAVQAAGADAHGDDERRRKEAERLMNEQDGGSVAYRFGVLPVLIDGQLMELDLVHFREHREPQQPPGLRRLVMTFSTPTLGRIEVAAQALADRLAISITADSVQTQQALAARAGEVRELVARLGWNVDSVSYELDTSVARAARHVIEHVLTRDTFSKLV